LTVDRVRHVRSCSQSVPPFSNHRQCSSPWAWSAFGGALPGSWAALLRRHRLQPGIDRGHAVGGADHSGVDLQGLLESAVEAAQVATLVVIMKT
jgi:hypothetical protein